MGCRRRLAGSIAAVLAGVAAVQAQGGAPSRAYPPPPVPTGVQDLGLVWPPSAPPAQRTEAASVQVLASLPDELLIRVVAGDGETASSDKAPEKENLPPFGGPFLERPKLTGDWFGYRDAL